MDIHQAITSEMVGQMGTWSVSFIFHERSKMINSALNIHAQIIKNEALISTAPLVLFDGNISVDAMGTILELCKKYNRPGEFIFCLISWIFIIAFSLRKKN